MYKKPATTVLTVLLLFTVDLAFSQNVKFGKVSKEELQEKFYPLDSSANAAILYKKRRTHYEYSDEYGWRLITKIHERIKIYNKQGNDWATKSIRLYKDGNAETVFIKANTYNINNGKIVKIKLKKDNIFTENTTEYWRRKKFTMPNLKEGSVVEWEYKITSPYAFNINDMIFQYKIPLKYIDTEIRIPEFFVFKHRPNTYYPIAIQQSTKSRGLNFDYKTRNNDFGTGIRSSSNNTTVNFQEEVFSSIQENIPAIKKEPFINNLNNYISKTSFEYTAYKPYGGQHKFYNTTWADVTKTIYKSIRFGGELEKVSHFKNDLETLIHGTKKEMQLVTIFQFVKDKIKWDNSKRIYTNKGVRTAYKNGVGNVAEVNLTLVAMLREAGFNANPILISTRDHGIPFFPTKSGFNYVLAGVENDDGIILLDATEKYSLPNILPIRAINWQGRIVRKDGSSDAIDLFSQYESSTKVLLSTKLDSEGVFKGKVRYIYKNQIALKIRNNNNSIIEQDLINKLEKEKQDIEINALKILNDKNIYKPLIYNMSFESDNHSEIIGEKLYFSPLLFLTEIENPFKLETRNYPIDFGTAWKNSFNISIEIPAEYKIESTPKNNTYAMPDNLGEYKYICKQVGNKLQILNEIRIHEGNIPTKSYKALKEFYKLMIDKQLEKIILSKI